MRAVFLLLVAAVVASAQTPPVINNVRANNILTRFAAQRVTPGDMTFGITTPRTTTIIGDTYFDSHWGLSSIQLKDDDRLIEGYYTRYDVKNNEFEFLLGKEVRVLPGKKVKNVMWIDSLSKKPRVVTAMTDYTVEGVPLTGFMELLAEGDYPLFKRIDLEILKPDFSPALNVGSKDYRIIKKTSYYYGIGNDLHRLKNKKSLAALIAKCPKDVVGFMKAEAINTGQEDDLIRLFVFANPGR